MPTISELLQRVSGKKELTVNLVPQRFLQVFREHGVEAPQIPRIFPQISLDDLKSPDSLLKKLTPAVLDEVSALFGVRFEWLEGVDERIYPYCESYKQPRNFFEDLNAIKFDSRDFPVRLLTSAEKLDFKDDSYQPLALVVVEKIAQIGEEDIHRYYIYDNIWDWKHPPCRLQLKAIGRLIYQNLRKPVPILKVSYSTLEAIGEQRLIPRAFIEGCLITEPSLEDFGLSREQSRIAKEVEELHEVLEFIKFHNLEPLAESLRNKLTSSDELPIKEVVLKPSQKEKASKAATKKNEAGNILKIAFIEQYAEKVSAKEISAAQAARDFYDKLDESGMKSLCRSARDYETGTSDELRWRGVRTLTAAMTQHFKAESG